MHMVQTLGNKSVSLLLFVHTWSKSVYNAYGMLSRAGYYMYVGIIACSCLWSCSHVQHTNLYTCMCIYTCLVVININFTCLFTSNLHCN